MGCLDFIQGHKQRDTKSMCTLERYLSRAAGKGDWKLAMSHQDKATLVLSPLSFGPQLPINSSLFPNLPAVDTEVHKPELKD